VDIVFFLVQFGIYAENGWGETPRCFCGGGNREKPPPEALGCAPKTVRSQEILRGAENIPNYLRAAGISL